MTNEYLMTGENAHDMTVHEKRLKIVSTASSYPEGNKSNCFTVVMSVLRLGENFSLYCASFPNFTESAFLS